MCNSTQTHSTPCPFKIYENSFKIDELHYFMPIMFKFACLPSWREISFLVSVRMHCMTEKQTSVYSNKTAWMTFKAYVISTVLDVLKTRAKMMVDGTFVVW